MNDAIEPGQPGKVEEPPKRQYSRVLKGIIVVGFIIGFVLYRVLFPQPLVECIYDAYFDWTIHANRGLVTHPNRGAAYEGKSNNDLSVEGRAVIGTGQVLMDLWIGIFGIVW